MYLKKNLKYFREKNNLSYRELAKELKINHVTIFFIESGKTINPQINEVNKLAIFFNVNLDDFINKDLKNKLQNHDIYLEEDKKNEPNKN